MVLSILAKKMWKKILSKEEKDNFWRLDCALPSPLISFLYTASIKSNVLFFIYFNLVGTTKEHLGYALALNVPVFVVVNKVDMCRPAVLERTLSQLEQILKSPGVKRIPIRIENSDDAITAAGSLDSRKSVSVVNQPN